MEDGAIIHVDYDLFSGETGDLIETTNPLIEIEIYFQKFHSFVLSTLKIFKKLS